MEVSYFNYLGICIRVPHEDDDFQFETKLNNTNTDKSGKVFQSEISTASTDFHVIRVEEAKIQRLYSAGA